MNRSRGEIVARARAHTRNEQIGNFFGLLRMHKLGLVKIILYLIGLDIPFFIKKKKKMAQSLATQPNLCNFHFPLFLFLIYLINLTYL